MEVKSGSGVAETLGCSCSKNKRFFSVAAKKQHLRDSPKHHNICLLCRNEFRSKKELEVHLRGLQGPCPARIATPLDHFFQSFPSFSYDRALHPATSYDRLRKHQGWRRRSEEDRGAWLRFQEALRQEVEVWFGQEDDLDAWHTLFRALGSKKPLANVEDCVKVRIQCPRHGRHLTPWV